MEYMELNDNKVKISAMGIADFLVGVTEKVKEGYELNYLNNDMYPVAYGGYFEVVVQKVQAQKVQAEEVKEDKVEVEGKRGRKAKVD